DPTDVVKEIRRQLRELSDTPGEWVPPDSLDLPKLRIHLGRPETDRDSDVTRASKEYVVSVIRTRCARILEGVEGYLAEMKHRPGEGVQIEYLNYDPMLGPIYTFDEAEAKRISGQVTSKIESDWRELFGQTKHAAFDTEEHIRSLLESAPGPAGGAFGSLREFGWHMTRVVVQEDDIDHLGNRRLRTIDELASEELRKGFLKMRRTVQERMSMKDPTEQPKIVDLVNTKSVSSAIEYFFGRSELSQVVD